MFFEHEAENTHTHIYIYTPIYLDPNYDDTIPFKTQFAFHLIYFFNMSNPIPIILSTPKWSQIYGGDVKY